MDKMENMNDSLWERIESLIKSRNLNQKEFAAEIGVNPVTITEWKKGKSRSYQKLATIRRIADALGVSVEELTQNEPKQKQAPPPSNDSQTNESQLLAYFRRFNREGQGRMLDFAESMQRSGKYAVGANYFAQ